MQLVVVESPTKAKKIGQYLGNHYTVRASLGHVRDLPKSELGVDVEDHFTPKYVVPTKAKKTVAELKKLAQSAETIYLATDPDREGEAISWHLLESWHDPKLEQKSKRAVFHEITKEAVTKALAEPGKLNMALVDAQQARRVLDRLVGYQLSPLLWKKVRRGLSAGRVQSAALRLIVERDAEIAAFVPEEYWELDLDLATPDKEHFLARITHVDGESFAPKSDEQVAPLRTWVPQAAYSILSVETKERTRKALPPFTTSTLQQQASSRLGMTAKRSMILAQQLYEEGWITYHRTDSTALASSAVDMAREYIGKQFGENFLPDKPNFFATKSKNAQEAHEAIRTTSTAAALTIEGRMTASHAKLYDLIFRRFIASQMNQAIYDQTTILVEGKGSDHELQAKTTGSILKHAGWMQLFPSSEEVLLPAVEEKMPLKYTKFLTAQKFTQPPARFNDASLVKELEKRGIGRPSTYASIISVIQDRGYVDRQDKALVSTVIGQTVISFLRTNFADIVDFDFTAKLEDQLDDVALGKAQWQKVLAEFFGPFTKKLGEVEKTAQRLQVPVEPYNQTCPKCGVSPEEFAKLQAENKTLSSWTLEQKEATSLRSAEHGEVVIRMGRFGKFLSCSRYPDCDYTAKLVETINMACPTCGEGEVVAKKTKKGRTFYGCSRYPQCDFASWKKPGAAAEAEE